MAQHLVIIEDEDKIEDHLFWEKGYFKLFISRLSSNKMYATDLKESLSKFGILCFVAHVDIEPSALWQNEIELAFKTCDGLITLSEPVFH